MSQYSAEEQGFHNQIKAVVDVDETTGRIKRIWAENVMPNTIGAAGITTWLANANQAKTVDVDAISGASVSTSALRTAAIKAANKASGINIADDTDASTGVSQSDIPNKKRKTQELANYPLLKETITAYDVDKYAGEYDLIVVGSGGAGLAAAATAAENNAAVMVIEKQGIAGGTTNYSGGVIQAAGTKLQKETTDFQHDTPQKHEQEYLAAGEGRVYSELIHDFTQNSPANIA